MLIRQFAKRHCFARLTLGFDTKKAGEISPSEISAGLSSLT